jgi:ABC-type nitrate/sulfonate/bicarbonate transport system permease component
MKNKLKNNIIQLIKGSYIQLLSLVVLLFFWNYYPLLFGKEGVSLPTLGEVFKALKDLHARGFFINDLIMSMKRVYPALFYGSILGVIIGIITGRSAFLYKSIGSYFHLWRALPAVALVPVYIHLLGVSEFAKIFMIASGVFFPVWISTHEGASQLPVIYKELSKNLKLSKLWFNLKIVVPFSLSYSIGGIRTGIAFSFIMLFVAEWMGANEGIGYRISLAHTIDKLDIMFVGLILLGLMAFVTDSLFKLLVSIVFPWIKYSK